MNRTHRIATLFLGQVGVALLVISVLLVPQSQSLAIKPPPLVCDNAGQQCELTACQTYYPLNVSCPGTCSTDGTQYCNCVVDFKNCGGCVCVKNPVQDSCYCHDQ